MEGVVWQTPASSQHAQQHSEASLQGGAPSPIEGTQTARQRGDWVCSGERVDFRYCGPPQKGSHESKAWRAAAGSGGSSLVVSEWLQMHNFPQVSKRSDCAGQGYETWCASRVCLCRGLAPCYHRTGSLHFAGLSLALPSAISTRPHFLGRLCRAMSTTQTTRLNPRPGRASRAASMDMARGDSAGRKTLLVAHPRRGRLWRQAADSSQGPGPWDGEFALALR